MLWQTPFHWAQTAHCGHPIPRSTSLFSAHSNWHVAVLCHNSKLLKCDFFLKNNCLQNRFLRIQNFYFLAQDSRTNIIPSLWGTREGGHTGVPGSNWSPLPGHSRLYTGQVIHAGGNAHKKKKETKQNFNVAANQTKQKIPDRLLDSKCRCNQKRSTHQRGGMKHTSLLHCSVKAPFKCTVSKPLQLEHHTAYKLVLGNVVCSTAVLLSCSVVLLCWP